LIAFSAPLHFALPLFAGIVLLVLHKSSRAKVS
jgi:hypothetical protein